MDIGSWHDEFDFHLYPTYRRRQYRFGGLGGESRRRVTMNARLISLRKFPPDMVAHLRLLAAERPGDTAIIAVHQAGDDIVERKFDYET